MSENKELYEVFTYGLFNRPAMYGTAPTGFTNEQAHEHFAYGTIDYARRLTDEEIFRYEMARVSPNTFDIPIGAAVERLDACEGGYIVKAYYRGRYILTHKATGDEEYSMKVSDVKLDQSYTVRAKNRKKELTKRFRKAAWGRLYWKANDHRGLRMFESDDVCIVMDGSVTIHYKSIEAFVKELEEWEDTDKQVKSSFDGDDELYAGELHHRW